MRWPVSRERFEEVKSRADRLEEEKRALQLEIMALKIAAATTFDRSAPVEAWQPIPGKPTIAIVTAEANKAALRAAETPGAKGVAQELMEQQTSHFRRPIGK